MLRFIERSLSPDVAALAKPWIGYEEPRGRMRAAQPDLVFFNSNQHRIILFEIKLTRCAEGYEQLERLYAPLCRALWSYPVSGVVVFKQPDRGFVPHSDAPGDLRTALLTAPDHISEWHLLL